MREKIKVPFFDWRPNLVAFFFYTITRNMQITSHVIHESILRPTQKGRDQRWMPYQNPDGSKTWLAVKWSTERSMTSTCCSYRNPTKTDTLRRGLLGGWDETMTKGNNSEVFRNFLWPDKSSITTPAKTQTLACMLRSNGLSNILLLKLHTVRSTPTWHHRKTYTIFPLLKTTKCMCK